jgi:hypothetical protein
VQDARSTTAVASSIGGVELMGAAIGDLLFSRLKTREELADGYRISAPEHNLNKRMIVLIKSISEIPSELL